MMDGWTGRWMMDRGVDEDGWMNGWKDEWKDG